MKITNNPKNIPFSKIKSPVKNDKQKKISHSIKQKLSIQSNNIPTSRMHYQNVGYQTSVPFVIKQQKNIKQSSQQYLKRVKFNKNKHDAIKDEFNYSNNKFAKINQLHNMIQNNNCFQYFQIKQQNFNNQLVNIFTQSINQNYKPNKKQPTTINPLTKVTFNNNHQHLKLTNHQNYINPNRIVNRIVNRINQKTPNLYYDNNRRIFTSVSSNGNVSISSLPQTRLFKSFEYIKSQIKQKQQKAQQSDFKQKYIQQRINPSNIVEIGGSINHKRQLIENKSDLKQFKSLGHSKMTKLKKNKLLLTKSNSYNLLSNTQNFHNNHLKVYPMLKKTISRQNQVENQYYINNDKQGLNKEQKYFRKQPSRLKTKSFIRLSKSLPKFEQLQMHLGQNYVKIHEEQSYVKKIKNQNPVQSNKNTNKYENNLMINYYPETQNKTSINFTKHQQDIDKNIDRNYWVNDNIKTTEMLPMIILQSPRHKNVYHSTHINNNQQIFINSSIISSLGNPYQRGNSNRLCDNQRTRIKINKINNLSQLNQRLILHQKGTLKNINYQKVINNLTNYPPNNVQIPINKTVDPIKLIKNSPYNNNFIKRLDKNHQRLEKNHQIQASNINLINNGTNIILTQRKTKRPQTFYITNILNAQNKCTELNRLKQQNKIMRVISFHQNNLALDKSKIVNRPHSSSVRFTFSNSNHHLNIKKQTKKQNQFSINNSQKIPSIMNTNPIMKLFSSSKSQPPLFSMLQQNVNNQILKDKSDQQKISLGQKISSGQKTESNLPLQSKPNSANFLSLISKNQQNLMNHMRQQIQHQNNISHKNDLFNNSPVNVLQRQDNKHYNIQYPQNLVKNISLLNSKNNNQNSTDAIVNSNSWVSLKDKFSPTITNHNPIINLLSNNNLICDNNMARAYNITTNNKINQNNIIHQNNVIYQNNVICQNNLICSKNVISNLANNVTNANINELHMISTHDNKNSINLNQRSNIKIDRLHQDLQSVSNIIIKHTNTIASQNSSQLQQSFTKPLGLNKFSQNKIVQIQQIQLQQKRQWLNINRQKHSESQYLNRKVQTEKLKLNNLQSRIFITISANENIKKDIFQQNQYQISNQKYKQTNQEQFNPYQTIRTINKERYNNKNNQFINLDKIKTVTNFQSMQKIQNQYELQKGQNQYNIYMQKKSSQNNYDHIDFDYSLEDEHQKHQFQNQKNNNVLSSSQNSEIFYYANTNNLSRKIIKKQQNKSSQVKFSPIITQKIQNQKLKAQSNKIISSLSKGKLKIFKKDTNINKNQANSSKAQPNKLIQKNQFDNNKQRQINDVIRIKAKSYLQQAQNGIKELQKQKQGFHKKQNNKQKQQTKSIQTSLIQQLNSHRYKYSVAQDSVNFTQSKRLSQSKLMQLNNLSSISKAQSHIYPKYQSKYGIIKDQNIVYDLKRQNKTDVIHIHQLNKQLYTPFQRNHTEQLIVQHSFVQNKTKHNINHNKNQGNDGYNNYRYNNEEYSYQMIMPNQSNFYQSRFQQRKYEHQNQRMNDKSKNLDQSQVIQTFVIYKQRFI